MRGKPSASHFYFFFVSLFKLGIFLFLGIFFFFVFSIFLSHSLFLLFIYFLFLYIYFYVLYSYLYLIFFTYFYLLQGSECLQWTCLHSFFCIPIAYCVIYCSHSNFVFPFTVVAWNTNFAKENRRRKTVGGKSILVPTFSPMKLFCNSTPFTALHYTT